MERYKRATCHFALKTCTSAAHFENNEIHALFYFSSSDQSEMVLTDYKLNF